MPIPKTVIDVRLLEWATPTQAKYLEAVNRLGSGGAASLELGVVKSAVNESLRRLRDFACENGYFSHGVPGAVEAPMSEDAEKFHADWTPEMCIAELRRIALIDETKVITRNYFRNESKISESTWNRYFGTFEEFKRQAGIILSRHAHRLEKNIAMHASKDRQRSMNEEKRGWEDAYLRPVGKRFQTVIVCSDIHDMACDPFYRRLLIDTTRRVQPEKVVLNGDIFDLAEFGKYANDPRTFNPVKRIEWVHALLADFREACPDTEITFVEGNHEFRLLRHLTEATPALMTVLADLHGMTISSLLGLDKFELNYVARMDLAAFNEADVKKELSKNYVIMWDSVLFNHFPEGKNFGYPGANGHHHKHIVWNDYSPIFGSFEWHQLGCGHMPRASYCAGEKWSQGFLLCHVDTHKKHTQFEYIDTTFGHSIIGGRFYERSDDERRAA